MKLAAYSLAALLLVSPAWAAESGVQTLSTSSSVNTPASPGAMADSNSPDAQKFALAHQLLELTNYSTNLKNIVEITAGALLPTIVHANPNQVDKVRGIVVKAMSDAMVAHSEEYKNNTAMVYASTFSLDELQKIVGFYQTDAGKKMASMSPQILQQSMAINKPVSMVVAKEAVRAIAEELKTNGLIVPKELGI